MTDSTTPSQVPAGWYPDPAGGPRPRWWDGTAWTDHYADPAPQQAAAPAQPAAPAAPEVPVPPVPTGSAHTSASTGGYDPAQPYGSGFSQGATTGYPSAAPYAANAELLTAPPGTPTSTPWIWLLIFLPLLAILPLFFVDFAGYAREVAADPTNTSEADFRLYTSPAMLAAIGIGLLIVPLSVLFAWLDWRALKNAGVPQPFHFVWVLFILLIGTAAVYTIGRAVVVKRRTGSGLAPLVWTIVVLVLIIVLTIVLAGIVIGQIVAAMPAGSLS